MTCAECYATNLCIFYAAEQIDPKANAFFEMHQIHIHLFSFFSFAQYLSAVNGKLNADRQKWTQCMHGELFEIFLFGNQRFS